MVIKFLANRGRTKITLISNFRHVLNVVFFFGWSPVVWTFCADVSEHSVCPIFTGVICIFLLTSPIKMELRFPKRRHIKFRQQGITQNKEYNKGYFALRHPTLYKKKILSFSYPKIVGNKFLRNNVARLPNYTTPHAIRPQSEFSPPWKQHFSEIWMKYHCYFVKVK